MSPSIAKSMLMGSLVICLTSAAVDVLAQSSLKGGGSGEAPAFIPMGDLNSDFAVDGADLLRFQRFNGEIYDDIDLANWETNFRSHNARSPIDASVPEPSSILLAILSFAGLATLARR